MFQSQEVSGEERTSNDASIAQLEPSTEKNRFLVLAVDDDDDNLLLLEYALELIGVYCAVAQTGQETKKMALQQPFDLILLDILLPDMNGIELLQWLKTQSLTCSTPVIAITALARPGDRDRIIEAGFTGYLLKPYLLDDLNRIVRKYLWRGKNLR